ncbi:MAG TPA: hypothetical protein VF961_04330 [Pyrinomonadaceae bacterium]
MTISLTISLSLLLFALAFPYLAGPVLVRYRPGVKAHQRFVLISDKAARLRFPPQSFSVISQLEALGFSIVAHLASGDEITKVNSMLSLLVNRDSRAAAIVGRAFVSKRNANAVIEFVAFSTEFDDGSEIVTSNSPVVNVFREVSHRLRLSIPQLKDPSRLYYIHSHYVTSRVDCKPVLVEAGEEIEHFRASHKKALSEQAALGYYYLDETTERYRHSWSSAILTTWRLLWPVKQVLMLCKARRGRLIARAAGITNL